MSLTIEERVMRVKNGEEECDLLIKDYMPLFKKEANRIYVKGMDFEDKVNYLAFLFYKNIFRFDETKGLKFLTMTITDMRYRLLNADRAENSQEKGGKMTFVSSNVALPPKEMKLYREATKSYVTGLDYTLKNEIFETIDEIMNDWEEDLKIMVYDYISTGDSIAAVKKKYEDSPVSYHVLKKRIKLIRVELEKHGYSL